MNDYLHVGSGSTSANRATSSSEFLSEQVQLIKYILSTLIKARYFQYIKVKQAANRKLCSRVCIITTR